MKCRTYSSIEVRNYCAYDTSYTTCVRHFLITVRWSTQKNMDCLICSIEQLSDMKRRTYNNVDLRNWCGSALMPFMEGSGDEFSNPNLYPPRSAFTCPSPHFGRRRVLPFPASAVSVWLVFTSGLRAWNLQPVLLLLWVELLRHWSPHIRHWEGSWKFTRHTPL